MPKKIQKTNISKNGNAKRNGIKYEQPFQRLEGESDEDREKRLKKREALSLKVMRMAYEDYQAGKWSSR